MAKLGWVVPDDVTGNRYLNTRGIQAKHSYPRQSRLQQYRWLKRSCGGEGFGTEYDIVAAVASKARSLSWTLLPMPQASVPEPFASRHDRTL